MLTHPTLDLLRQLRLDGMAKAFAEIEASAPRDRSDRRPIPQRRADALVSICKQYLAGRDDGPGPRRGRTHVSVVADIGALAGITDDFLTALH